ncbi:hypothetical protein [Nannocystis pusilla]|uniref:hypothetical protein n=1 Tax=Nannocystis pusilla TaxID=889268 RepID=UPI003B82DCEC
MVLGGQELEVGGGVDDVEEADAEVEEVVLPGREVDDARRRERVGDLVPVRPGLVGKLRVAVADRVGLDAGLEALGDPAVHLPVVVEQEVVGRAGLLVHRDRLVGALLRVALEALAGDPPPRAPDGLAHVARGDLEPHDAALGVAARQLVAGVVGDLDAPAVDARLQVDRLRRSDLERRRAPEREVDARERDVEVGVVDVAAAGAAVQRLRISTIRRFAPARSWRRPPVACTMPWLLNSAQPATLSTAGMWQSWHDLNSRPGVA